MENYFRFEIGIEEKKIGNILDFESRVEFEV